VFLLTQDYSRRLLWDPFLKEARLLDGAPDAALGVRAWCVSKSGFGMETEYVAFRPPHAVAVRMTRGPFFLKAFAASWRFFDLGTNGTTKVSFKYFVELRGPLRAFMPLVRYAFTLDTKKRLDGLKRYFEDHA
jgi:hypothetical protein